MGNSSPHRARYVAAALRHAGVFSEQGAELPASVLQLIASAVATDNDSGAKDLYDDLISILARHDPPLSCSLPPPPVSE